MVDCCAPLYAINAYFKEENDEYTVQELKKYKEHEWKNLYRFSQQGWELLNSLIKRFFFLRTNKGGGKNTSRSRLIPIARLFQRRILWLSGLAEKFLSGQNTENKNDGVEDVAIHDI